MTASCHITRRYSTKGGMEKYVWELTHALAELGQQVTVVCEQQEEPLREIGHPDGCIQVITLGVIKPKPRWRSMIKFSAKVSDYFRANPFSGVIHSHERTSEHQVTTIHGPSILSRKKRLLDGLSPRLRTWELLERREILAPQVHVVLPNSTLVAEQLTRFYPEVSSRLAVPALPGVSDKFFKLREERTLNLATIDEPIKCAFIGTEWKRKSLEFVTKTFADMAGQGQIHLTVVGPAPEEIQHLFSQWPADSYDLLGWASPLALLANIDCLLHPALNEPFGMAIAEANVAGCHVLVSESCGIAPLLTPEMGKVLPLESRVWQESLQQLKATKEQVVRQLPPALELSWQQLAMRHVDIYLSIQTGKRIH